MRNQAKDQKKKKISNLDFSTTPKPQGSADVHKIIVRYARILAINFLHTLSEDT